MKIDLTTVIQEFDGTTVKYKKSPEDSGIDLTLKIVLVDAIKAGDRTPNQEPTENVKLYRLGRTVWEAQDEVELTAAEIVTVQKLICSYWGSPVVKGQACELLDNAKSEPKLAAVPDSK